MTLDYIQCDRCGARNQPESSMADVSAYKDNGDALDWTWFDLCKPCFFGWLVPLLGDQGVHPSYDIHSETGVRIER